MKLMRIITKAVVLISGIVYIANDLLIRANEYFDLGAYKILKGRVDFVQEAISLPKLLITGLMIAVFFFFDFVVNRKKTKKKKEGYKNKTILFAGCGTVILICMVYQVLTCIRISDGLIRQREIAKMRNMIRTYRYIIHAGGFLEDKEGNQYSYTNSKETLESCYNNGNRISEYDFMLTKDGDMVCAHDEADDVQWARGFDWDEDAGWTKDNPPNKEEFLEASYEGLFDTMSLDDIIEFISEHKDFYIITDVKESNEIACNIIKEKCPDLLDNFIIQIYHEDEYEMVRDMGFRNIIYTMYRCTEEEMKIDNICRFVKSHDLVGYTFFYFKVDDDPFYYQLHSTETPLYVHTVNDMDAMKHFFDKGVSGIYTDVVRYDEQYR